MKSKDYALVILAVMMGAIISYLLTGMFISTPDKRQQQVEVVGPITAEFELPNSSYFNEQSVNPTKQIQLDDQPNSNPFAAR